MKLCARSDPQAFEIYTIHDDIVVVNNVGVFYAVMALILKVCVLKGIKIFI